MVLVAFHAPTDSGHRGVLHLPHLLLDWSQPNAGCSGTPPPAPVRPPPALRAVPCRVVAWRVGHQTGLCRPAADMVAGPTGSTGCDPIGLGGGPRRAGSAVRLLVSSQQTPAVTDLGLEKLPRAH